MRPLTSGDLTRTLVRLSKVAIAIVGVVYALGVMIVNLHLAGYGLIATELVRTDYILAGALWAVLTVAGLAGFRITRNRLRLAWSHRSSLMKRTFVAAWEGVSALAVAIVALTLLSGGVIGAVLDGSRLVITGFVVWVLIISLYVNGKVVNAFFAVDRSTQRRSIPWLGFMFFISLTFYSLFAYPWFTRSLGGGQTVVAYLYLRSPIPELYWPIYRMSISRDGTRLGPANLILETERRVVVGPVLRRRDIILRFASLHNRVVAIGIDPRHITAIAYGAGLIMPVREEDDDP